MTLSAGSSCSSWPSVCTHTPASVMRFAGSRGHDFDTNHANPQGVGLGLTTAGGDTGQHLYHSHVTTVCVELCGRFAADQATANNHDLVSVVLWCIMHGGAYNDLGIVKAGNGRTSRVGTYGDDQHIGTNLVYVICIHGSIQANVHVGIRQTIFHLVPPIGHIPLKINMVGKANGTAQFCTLIAEDHVMATFCSRPCRPSCPPGPAPTISTFFFFCGAAGMGSLPSNPTSGFSVHKNQFFAKRRLWHSLHRRQRLQSA